MTTFPDEKMIEAAKDRAVVSPYVAQLVIETAFANLKERTGIDAGDVLAKMVAGTHVLVEAKLHHALLEASARDVRPHRSGN